MDLTTLSLLSLDGVTLGTVYALIALSTVLVFSVTRVIFIAGGELLTFSALTLATLQSGEWPFAVLLSMTLGAACVVADFLDLFRSSRPIARHLVESAGRFLLAPSIAFAASFYQAWASAPMLAQVLFTLTVVVPMGPALYRLFFQPLRDASVLTLLIASFGVHLAMVGIGLVIFGAEGMRTRPFSDARFTIGPLLVPAQTLYIAGAAAAIGVALYLFSGFTITGKALRATAFNRLGARLVGIETTRAGYIAFGSTAAILAMSGMLIAPVATFYYDSGFVIGLKGFIGAVIAGLVSYPVAVLGALAVGFIESYTSFAASAAKDGILFALVIPLLLFRSLRARRAGVKH